MLFTGWSWSISLAGGGTNTYIEQPLRTTGADINVLSKVKNTIMGEIPTSAPITNVAVIDGVGIIDIPLAFRSVANAIVATSDTEIVSGQIRVMQPPLNEVQRISLYGLNHQGKNIESHLRVIFTAN